MTYDKIVSEYDGDLCNLTIPIPKTLKNIKSCDIFIGENDFLFVCNNFICSYKCRKKIDVIDMKNLEIKFTSEKNEFTCSLPCLPDEQIQKSETIKYHEKTDEIFDNISLNILNLRRITNSCQLIIDGEIQDFEVKFGYGFGCQSNDDTSLIESTLSAICKVSNPSKCSPLGRWYLRETDEVHDFCRDQYKLNFVELQIPEGLENPMIFTFNFNDTKLNKDQQYIFENICNKNCEILDEEKPFIDCGLIEILFGICYDIRSMQNETTCESGWTRSILSPNLTYFETISNLKDCVKIFLRRSLIYPLYRNYDFSRICVQDTVDALQFGKDWIIKQLLITYEVFQTSPESRQLLNFYFIENYLRYLKNISNEDLNTISLNLKNVLMNITKKDIGLNLNEIETEILKELVDDIHIADSSDSDDDSDEEETSEEENETTEDATSSKKNEELK